MSKTTVLMADEIIAEARQLSQKRGTTLSNVMQAALVAYIAQHKNPVKFSLRKKHSSQTGGMLIHDWDAIRDTIYAEREQRLWKP
ncbi:MAG: hypothetical protein JSR44_14925 [Spirochaetes bacterium]|nr:hypothetical protein [Spirochaetota bacterium]